MGYEEAIEYLYNSLPVFQREGATAYKPGLERSMALDSLFGNPHRRYATIHVAGTNGKGSTSHTLAAVLARAGYKVGLYTSPHIFDFRERIRVNGQKISSEAVVSFVERWKGMESPLQPSFFELTSTMAFEYFADCGVDVAVIETGLGGRLDSTNIITPVLSIITNISLDHTALLGDTLEKIAVEKAGIIKRGVPVVIGEYQQETAPVFEAKAHDENSPLIFATEIKGESQGERLLYRHSPFGEIEGELTGEWQVKNSATVIAALGVLKSLGFVKISDSAVREGFANVCHDTGLFGRWTTLSRSPRVVADTGHNIGGWEYIVDRIEKIPSDKSVSLIIGFVNDKDISKILRRIAGVNRPLRLFFSAPSVPRGLPAEMLACQAKAAGLSGEIVSDVNDALAKAKSGSGAEDLIIIAGSNFLVADLKGGSEEQDGQD